MRGTGPHAGGAAGGVGVGQARWNQLRGCAPAVFDLGSGTPVASVCHALGMALALGVQPMVIAPEAGLPLDIDIRAALPGESRGRCAG